MQLNDNLPPASGNYGRGSRSGQAPTTKVWAHCEWHNCTGEDMVELDSTPVVSLYATEQTAKQARDRAGFGYVTQMEIRTKVRA